MELFFRDAESEIEVSWDKLIYDLNHAETYNTYCKSDNYYSVFKHILLSLLLEKELILLDADFTAEEVFKLCGQKEFDTFEQPLNKKKFHFIQSKTDLTEQIKASKTDWKITLFTSGTTGIPKKVSHGFDSLTRFVKNTSADCIWGFAYNPTHFAGLQLFFQAILNGNAIIRLFDLQKEQIINEIEKFGITHISATPTFYRLLLPLNKTFPTLTRITSGGEKFDAKTMQELNVAFPNAKFTNVYASTEAGTLFASEGDVFIIKPEMKQWVKIEQNELFIHRDLMGASDFNTSAWYATGDLLEIINNNPLQFRFLSRKNEMINVGGYKVNPTEVEDVIRNFDGIKDARVYAKSNKILGNVICCEVVRSNPILNEIQIRKYLQTKLQEYKIPRIFEFADAVSTTHTGKIKR